MSANQACFPIAAMARVLGVSKAGYYAWLQRPPSARATADAALLKRIKTVHASSRQTYGAPRVHADLHGHGERHSRKRIARLMREAGLVGASHRHGGPTTTRRNKDDRPAPDLVDRDFNAAGPNQLWVADITYVPTMAGFLYLAVVLDCVSAPRRDPTHKLPQDIELSRRFASGEGSRSAPIGTPFSRPIAPTNQSVVSDPGGVPLHRFTR